MDEAGPLYGCRRSAPIRYAGYAYDEHSGLHYLSQRYYDPVSRNFLSKDPARADGEESAYQYCGGDPVGKVDPSGLRTYRITWYLKVVTKLLRTWTQRETTRSCHSSTPVSTYEWTVGEHRIEVWFNSIVIDVVAAAYGYGVAEGTYRTIRGLGERGWQTFGRRIARRTAIGVLGRIGLAWGIPRIKGVRTSGTWWIYSFKGRTKWNSRRVST